MSCHLIFSYSIIQRLYINCHSQYYNYLQCFQQHASIIQQNRKIQAMSSYTFLFYNTKGIQIVIVSITTIYSVSNNMLVSYNKIEQKQVMSSYTFLFYNTKGIQIVIVSITTIYSVSNNMLVSYNKIEKKKQVMSSYTFLFYNTKGIKIVIVSITTIYSVSNNMLVSYNIIEKYKSCHLILSYSIIQKVYKLSLSALQLFTVFPTTC